MKSSSGILILNFKNEETREHFLQELKTKINDALTECSKDYPYLMNLLKQTVEAKSYEWDSTLFDEMAKTAKHDSSWYMSEKNRERLKIFSKYLMTDGYTMLDPYRKDQIKDVIQKLSFIEPEDGDKDYFDDIMDIRNNLFIAYSKKATANDMLRMVTIPKRNGISTSTADDNGIFGHTSMRSIYRDTMKRYPQTIGELINDDYGLDEKMEAFLLEFGTQNSEASTDKIIAANLKRMEQISSKESDALSSTDKKKIKTFVLDFKRKNNVMNMEI